MRKLFAASLMTLPLFGLGCQHTGGICDCAPIPGDSVTHNPHLTYHTTAPGGVGPAVVAPSSPISNGSTDGFEPIGPPKKMPKLKK